MNEKIVPILKLAIIVTLNICIIGLMSYSPAWNTNSIDALSKNGSKGQEVTAIQKKLQQYGYKVGTVDGIYGANTEKAIRQFQKNNGLSVDGIAGPATLAALGLPTGSTNTSGGSNNSGGSVSNSDYELLARIISAEARGEPYTGQVAVGAVVLNRVEHPSFPDTIAGVVYQPGAFSAINDGQINEAVSDSARRAAKECLNGSDPSGGAIYYFNPDKTSNKWMRTRPVIKRIGAHLFCS